MPAGWRPISMSTTLSRNFFWYVSLGMGPRDTVYHVLWGAGLDAKERSHGRSGDGPLMLGWARWRWCWG